MTRHFYNYKYGVYMIVGYCHCSCGVSQKRMKSLFSFGLTIMLQTQQEKETAHHCMG